MDNAPNFRSRLQAGTYQKMKFLRLPMDSEQVTPKEGGDLLQLLKKYVNMDAEDLILFGPRL